METTEKKVTDRLREIIMDFINGDYECEPLTQVSHIESTICDVEDAIKSLEEERDRYHRWYTEDHKIVNAIKGS